MSEKKPQRPVFKALLPNSRVVKTLESPRYLPAGHGGRVMQVFLNQDLRLGHDGLREVAMKNKIDVSKLAPGQYVVFINAAKDQIKLFAANNVLVNYKRPGGGRIDMNAIKEIPRAFNASGNLDYDKALKTAVEEALARRARRKATEAPLAVMHAAQSA